MSYWPRLKAALAQDAIDELRFVNEQIAEMKKELAKLAREKAKFDKMIRKIRRLKTKDVTVVKVEDDY